MDDHQALEHDLGARHGKVVSASRRNEAHKGPRHGGFGHTTSFVSHQPLGRALQALAQLHEDVLNVVTRTTPHHRLEDRCAGGARVFNCSSVHVSRTAGFSRSVALKCCFRASGDP